MFAIRLAYSRPVFGLGVVLALCVGAQMVQSAPSRQPVELPGSGSRTFPETGKTVRGLFLEYWDAHGGLAQQGYPISEVMSEVSDLDGKSYTVQYFERAVFEYHPENQPPYNVLLSQLGTFQYREKYPDGAPNQQPNNAAGSQLFTQTGKRVGGKFLEYWNKNGGLAQQGFPISDEFMEESDLDGKTYRVQYFERAVFELHPENQPPYDVLLSQLGTFQYRDKYLSATSSPSPGSATAVTSPTPQRSATPAPSGGGGPSGGPTGRAGHELVYHDGLRMVLLVNGGDEAGEPAGSPTSIWGWDGREWRVVTSDGPEVRSLGGVAYDPDRNALVMYGGATRNRVYGDTWEWDGTRWLQKATQGPGFRHHMPMVYDAQRKQIVVYGGILQATESTQSEVSMPDDTWTWDGQTWRQAAEAGFGSRYHHPITYDAARQRVLVFGGVGQFGDTNSLWGWNGTTWSEYIPQGSVPSARFGARMAFDERSGKALMFGGRVGRRIALDDTWEWDGTQWNRLTVPGAHPSARSHHAMAYDRNRGRIVLYGGATQDDTQLADTWEWDGSAWTKVAGP